MSQSYYPTAPKPQRTLSPESGLQGHRHAARAQIPHESVDEQVQEAMEMDRRIGQLPSMRMHRSRGRSNSGLSVSGASFHGRSAELSRPRGGQRVHLAEDIHQRLHCRGNAGRSARGSNYNPGHCTGLFLAKKLPTCVLQTGKECCPKI